MKNKKICKYDMLNSSCIRINCPYKHINKPKIIDKKYISCKYNKTNQCTKDNCPYNHRK
jgi:hypothetical protein